MTQSIEATAAELCSLIAEWRSVCVAFSGGVDSSVVAKAAYLAVGDRSVAIVGVGPALAGSDLETARQVAGHIGIELREVTPNELASAGYVSNAGDRCYFCKTALYESCNLVAAQLELATIANGTNSDDLGDYRPGLVAAAEFEIRSPLAELQIDKLQVRELARFWNLPVWDKPASPCLASRIAPGVEVTASRLQMVEHAEAIVRRLTGFADLRVRVESGDLARIEVPARHLESAFLKIQSADTVEELKSLGFRRVTFDLEGLQSGNLNALVPLEVAKSAGQSRA